MAPRFASRFFWRTLVIVYAYAAVHVLLSQTLAAEGTALYVVSQILIILLQSMLVAALTLTYTRSRQAKRKRRTSPKKEADAQAVPPEDRTTED